jgi:hypothetical protein
MAKRDELIGINELCDKAAALVPQGKELVTQAKLSYMELEERKRLARRVNALAHEVAKLQELIAEDNYNNMHGFYWSNWTEGQIAKNVVEIGTCVSTIATLRQVADD